MENLTKVITGKSQTENTLSNPDVLFGKSGVNMTVFDEMLQDAHIYAKLEQLKDRVLSMQWSVQPADFDSESAGVAAFVKSCIENMGIKQLLQDMLMAVEYGFSVIEIVWEQDGAIWKPVKALGRRADRFVFTGSGELAVKDGMKTIPLKDEYKFLIHKHNSRNENPYGTPVLSKCYWPWMFKKAGFRYWLTVAEKYGVPTVLALFDSIDDRDSRERAKELAENLYNIQNDAAVALANVDSVQVLETKGTSKDFSELVQICNSEISKAITGEILTSDISSNGSYSLAKQHLETLQVKSFKIGKSIAETISQSLIKWIVDLNFDNGLYPKFVMDMKVEADWEIIKDAENMGFEIDKEEVAKRFGIPLSTVDNSLD
jgi:phage gp29-like protein